MQQSNLTSPILHDKVTKPQNVISAHETPFPSRFCASLSHLPYPLSVNPCASS